MIAAGIRKQFPENAGLDVTMVSWREDIVGNVRPTLLLLWGAVVVVLLIAICENVANLVLARSMARQQEFAIRVAIGAGRRRLARQIVAENMSLAVGGRTRRARRRAACSCRALPALGPIGIPRIGEATLDRVAIAFSVGLAALTGLGFGIWPLRRLEDVDLANDSRSARSPALLNAPGRSRPADAPRGRSLALGGLLIGAGLLIASLMRLQQIDRLRSDGVLTASVSLPASSIRRHRAGSAVRAGIDRADCRRSRCAGGGCGTGIPLGYTGWGKYLTIEGRPDTANPRASAPIYRQVTPGYFTRLVRLSAGAAFTINDDAHAPRVAIVNHALNRRFWSSEDPLGRRVYSPRLNR